MLVGMMGYKRSGKDSFASVLVEEYGYVRLAFADAMRDAAMLLNPYLSDGSRLADHVDRLGWDDAKANPDIRYVLQYLGTAVRDTLGHDAWVRPIRNRAVELMEEGRSVVITDVRFFNEAQMILDLGGDLLAVSRSGLVNSDMHISETGIPFEVATYNIQNDSTLEELHHTARMWHALATLTTL